MNYWIIFFFWKISDSGLSVLSFQYGLHSQLPQSPTWPGPIFLTLHIFFLIFFPDFAGVHSSVAPFERMHGRKISHPLHTWICLYAHLWMMILRIKIILLHHIEGVDPVSFNLQHFLRNQCYSQPQSLLCDLKFLYWKLIISFLFLMHCCGSFSI